MVAMTFFPLILALFGPLGLGVPATRIAPEQAKARHALVASHLQPGGDVYLIENREGRLQAMIEAVAQLAGMDDDSAAMFRNLDRLLREQGLYSLLGVGYSSVPREDGLKDFRLFLAREAEAGNLAVWRALLSGEAGVFDRLKYLPADAALTLAVRPDGTALWRMGTQTNRLLAHRDDAERAAQAVENLARLLGDDPAKLLASLGDQLVVSLHLATEGEPLPVRLGRATVPIPRPGILLVAKVNDERLLQFAIAKMGGMGGVDVRTDTASGQKIHAMAAALPVPLPLQIAAAQDGDTLLVGSTPALVAAAIKSAAEGGGMIASAAFVDLFGQAEVSANALFHGTPRVGELIRETVERLAENDGGPNVAALLGAFPTKATGWTLVNLRDGVLIDGRGTGAIGEQALRGAPLHLGMMAGMVLPAVGGARQRARSTACMANLRQIDNAKQTWAIQTNQAGDATPTAEDLAPYLPADGVAGLRCPMGGAYGINPVDQPPTCSHPGHRLPR